MPKDYIKKPSKEFHNVVKYCKICRKQLVLHSKRDIKRKNFCSRLCLGKFVGPTSNLGKHPSDEVRQKWSEKRQGRLDIKDWSTWRKRQSDAHLRRQEQGLEHQFKGKHVDFTTWGKRINFDGVVYKSRWEAYLAKLLSERNIEFIYEPKRFDLGLITYLPDFYLPIYDLYVEVKGFMDKESKKRLDLFKEKYPDLNLILFTENSLKNSGMSQYKLSKIFPSSEV